MTISSSLNALTKDQCLILCTLFKECRDMYPSRHAYDAVYRRLNAVTIMDLYREWKACNNALASGETFTSEILATTLHAGSSQWDVRRVRQVLGIFTRLEGYCDPSDALMQYKIRVSTSRGRAPSGIAERARDLISSWLGPAPSLLELYPKHGPGAVAEGVKVQADKRFLTYTFRQLAPYGADLLHLNANHLAHEPYKLEVLKHPITRVIAVPKDVSKPRIISCEPTVLQFLQQGVARYIMARLEAGCPYLSFRDQTINASLARNLACATLDLSDASDTVSRRIVWQLFPEDWRKLLFTLRSHFARLPDGTLVPLRAFAPMGSALCFPVESIVFAAVTVATILASSGERWVKEHRGQIAVYGDDIIVPVESAISVMTGLTLCGFRPNRSKCCINGSFRESCGAEWWNGHDVTVVRPKSLSPLAVTGDRHTTMGEMPMVSHARLLMQRGFSGLAALFASRCTFPVAIGDGDGYAPASLPWPKPGQLRWNTAYQRLEQQATLPVQVAQPCELHTGYAMLFMHLCSQWTSEQVLEPRTKPKLKWVLAAPFRER